jgi:NAD(P)-dependent dehydrogenase (short-subunit alcohol dehydrogenase family)
MTAGCPAPTPRSSGGRLFPTRGVQGRGVPWLESGGSSSDEGVLEWPQDTPVGLRRVRPGGAIINFSSSVVKIALPTYTAYAATKGAVDAMTLILAEEMRGRDVTSMPWHPGRPRRSRARQRGPSGEAARPQFAG